MPISITNDYQGNQTKQFDTSFNNSSEKHNNGYIHNAMSNLKNGVMDEPNGPILPLHSHDDGNDQSQKPMIVNFNSGAGTRTSVPGNYGMEYNYNGKQVKQRRRYIILIVIFFALGCAIGALTAYFSQPKSQSTDVCLTAECVRTATSLIDAMDPTADPCHDFFKYACGTWNKKHIIPEDRSSISTFEVLSDQQQMILKELLEEPINQNDNQATIKAKTFYKSCMNIQQIRKIGDNPLRQIISDLGGWPVVESDWTPPNYSVEWILGQIKRDFGEGVLFELFIGADDKNSSVNVLQLDQAQLALPSRDYYLQPKSRTELKAYHQLAANIAALLGADKERAFIELEDVIQFEVKLANISVPETDRHDSNAIYNKLTLAELQAAVPQLNWKEFLQATMANHAIVTDDEQIVCYGMKYLIEMGKIFAETDRRVIHNYMIWRITFNIMNHMIDNYQRERIEYKRILLGVQSERPRWSQCGDWTNKRLGMAVGALFIRDNFNEESKNTALEMIHELREAFNELLAENEWMDDETRAVAKEKADATSERIGYPHILKNVTELEEEYKNLTIDGDQFMKNLFEILKWDTHKNLEILRQPVDRDKWNTEPAVVNAFYNPNRNEIVIPAGILQPLFYSQYFPKALNYGGIGVVIGHEITHGFDDKGRQFDKDGNLMQWWNNSTIRAFRQRTQCMIDQYSKYRIDEVDLYMNGRMTQGENIADNGGLKQAFRAYKKWLKLNGDEPGLPGLNLTNDQLFFLNYAQIWCGSMRPEDALTKVRSSVHSPGAMRVLGPLSNSKDFANAYNCPLGSRMNPKNKCTVW